jgi:hypothetical protein
MGLAAAGLVVAACSGTAAEVTESTSTIAPPTTVRPFVPGGLAVEGPVAEVDLTAFVVDVEFGDGWDAGPDDQCPPPEDGPDLEACALIGPATLILDTGDRLEVPAGTPGDPSCLLRLSGEPEREPGVEYGPRCVMAIGLNDEGQVEWLDGWSGLQGRRPGESIDLPQGDVASLTEDGWAVTRSGWAYRLGEEVTAVGCGHLLQPDTVTAILGEGKQGEVRDFPDTLATSLTDLYRTWDGPDGTRLQIGPIDRTTTATVGAVTCTDLGYRMIDRARDLWDSRRPDSYRYVLSIFNSWGSAGTYEITVEGDRVTSMVIEEPWHQFGRGIDVGDMDWVFDTFVDPNRCSAGKCRHFITALFDSDWGYPTSVRFDNPDAIDDEGGILITSFEALDANSD